MMRMAGEIAIAIGGSLALSLIVKATVISAAALIAAHIARRSRASVRHVLLAAAFILLLALPLVSVVTPSREVSVPVPQAGSTVRVATLAPLRPAVPDSRFVDNGGLRADPVTGTLPSASRLLLAVWVIGVALVLLPMIAGLMHVRRVRQNGLPWRDGQAVVEEITAARAVRIRTQLLLDEAVVGPMTFGVLRPVIVLPRDVRVWDPEGSPARDRSRTGTHTAPGLVDAVGRSGRMRALLVPSTGVDLVAATSARGRESVR